MSSLYLQAFNKQLSEFLDDVERVLPTDVDIKAGKNSLLLLKKANPKKIIETLPTSEFTAYSENKGEKLAFCLEKEKGQSKLIDINTLTFVAIHELAHIASTQVGHGDEFWNNFKFLLIRAKENNIYKPQDYKKQPEKYCGMEISDNPYFDL